MISTALLVELFGYLGSVLVVVSMLMSSVVKLRVINVIGSVISGTYALIIGSFPLALMNICLIIINIYNLRKLLASENEYDLIDEDANDAFIGYFISHYKEDIAVYFPEFDGKKCAELDTAYLVCCGGDPAAVLLGKKQGEGKIAITLEYSTPEYRDCSAGKFLYKELEKKGVRCLTFSNAPQKHIPYLEKMGYKKDGERYQKELR